MGISHLHPSAAHFRVTRSKVMKGLGGRHLVANDRGTRRDICILTFFFLQETRGQSENDSGVVEGVPSPTSRSQQDCCQRLRGSGLALSSQILKTFKMEIHCPSGVLPQTAPASCGKIPNAQPDPVQSQLVAVTLLPPSRAAQVSVRAFGATISKGLPKRPRQRLTRSPHITTRIYRCSFF